MEREELIQSERFQIVRLLGKGACGKVYHVKDLQNSGRDLALKVLDGSKVFDKRLRDRFIKEILILCTIRHRNIVAAYEVVQLGEKDGYTMELVQGKDLGALLDRPNSTPLTLREIGNIMKQLLSGVEELHNSNIIHRDLKVDNIILRDDGLVKLNDLGLAKILHDVPMTDPGFILGTAHYMSPEYILNKTIDSRADIYACGVILWELMHGKRRYKENTEKVLLELIDNKFKHPMPEVTEENAHYVKILKKALAVNVNDRFQSVREMREAFDQHLLPVNKPDENTDRLFINTLWLLVTMSFLIIGYLTIRNEYWHFF